MKIANIINIIENNAPLHLQCDFDNSGLQIGNNEDILTGVLICLDITKQAISKALECGCNLIISHHPLFFNGVKKIDTTQYDGQIIEAIIKNNLTIYSTHTNIDLVANGLCDVWSKMIGINNPLFLYEDGLGRYGELEKPFKFGGFCDFISEVTNSAIKANGLKNKTILRVATINGSGGRNDEILHKLKALNVDCFITSEIKYSLALALMQNGINVVEVNHYDCEKHFMQLINNWIIKEKINVKTELFDYNPYNS